MRQVESDRDMQADEETRDRGGLAIARRKKTRGGGSGGRTTPREHCCCGACPLHPVVNKPLL